MNNAPQDQKETIMKTLAILGFVSVVIVTAFLVIKIVSFLPNAFSSLASLADGVYTAEDAELTLVADETIVNAGEPVTVRWSAPAEEGSYLFSYDCTEGVSLSLSIGDESETVKCGTEYDLGGNTEATLTIESERNRFTDVTYRVGYLPDGMDEVLIESDDLITIINASISPAPTATDTSTDVDEETEGEDNGVALDTEAPGTGLYEDDTDTDSDSPANDEPETPAQPAPEPEYVYEIPTSNPRGYTDLKVTFVGVGTLDNDGRFVRGSTIDNDRRGAFQFEVRNIGTKTSEDWSYEAELPNDMEYQSGEQSPLRPNERALITLGFEFEANETGIRDFSVEIDTDSDTFAGNDFFSGSVTVEN